MAKVKRKKCNGPLPIFLTMITLIIAGQALSAQTTWEFSGMSYEYQKSHFDSATNVIKTKLGVQMHTFGAPFNHNDATLLQVMSEDTNYKVIFFGQGEPSPESGQVNLSNRVFIESATGVPDYAYFLSDYNSKKAGYTDYIVMQGHPYAWTTPAKQTEFQNIVNFLISEGVEFTTPYEYYRYLTDLSIPRTSNVQIILKLDDMRATTSYFTPCLPTLDFLAANDIKAAIGVNKMEGLTQTQIETLEYYLQQTDAAGDTLFEIWNHGLDHSMSSATSGGNWSSASTWPGGTVPTGVDDVTIPAGVTVTIDVADAACNDLTIEGTLVAVNSAAASLTVNGDLLITSTGSFTSPSLTGGSANIVHTLSVYGNFTNSGGTFDFRMGSAGTTLRVMNTAFLGSNTSTISVGTYSSSNNDFNSITVNKTGGAKVVCASDVVCDPGSSAGVSQLILTSGIVETGSNVLSVLSTSSTDVVTPSSASYINGALGRGMTNSVGTTRSFPVGDGAGYRPITIRSTTGGAATGHHVVVRCIPANANSGSSTFSGGISAVSGVRYFQISYNKGIGAGAATMSFSQFSPSYGMDDGVEEGNTSLRVAYSSDERVLWSGMLQSTHTTSLSNPPTTITPTALTTPVVLSSGSGYIYAALASADEGNPLPVELSSFSAVARSGNIELSWSTATETNNAGFDVEKNVEGDWVKAGFVEGAGNSNAPRSYSFSEKNVAAGSYSYRLKQIDRDGKFEYSHTVEVNVVGAPTTLSLKGNYPNPFNPSTTISFTVPFEGRATVKVFDVLGKEVATVFNDAAVSGREYAVPFMASSLPSGIYFSQLEFNGQTMVKKMLLMK